MEKKMQRLCSTWFVMGCLIALAGLAVGCGVPQGSEGLSQRTQALQQLEDLSHDTFQKAEMHPLLQWQTAYDSLARETKPTHYATSQTSVQATALRYITFQVDWRGERYQVSSDLSTPQFALTVQRITRPLQLLCAPGRTNKTQKVLIQTQELGTVGPTQGKTESDTVRFERDAQALAHQVWTPMYQLWQLGRCSTQKRCNSEIFSDITLDFQAEPQFNCQMKIVLTKKSSKP